MQNKCKLSNSSVFIKIPLVNPTRDILVYIYPKTVNYKMHQLQNLFVI